MQASPYNIFSLPPELLESLVPRNLVQREATRPPTPEPDASATKAGPRACAVCQGVVFLDVNEQRAHFRSDWHRYNVKTRLTGGKPISEPEFSNLVEGLEDSLSGSASSDDDESDSDAVETLVKKSNKLTTRSSSPDPDSRELPVTALTWFHRPPSTQIGIYRTILPLKTEASSYVDELRAMQQPVPGGRTWAMFMTAGGHFAGAVVRVSDDGEVEQLANRKKHAKPKADTEVLLHKTFHRYTTRRKQGGSQSVNDNAKGKAKSAGAQLRRYGEQALRDDIRGLLNEWKDDIADCERIWIRASTSNRKIFYDYDEAPFAKNDERLRTFPFPTRRPTQSELTRCLNELIRAKISHYTEDDLRIQDKAYLAALPKPRPAPTVAPPQPPKEKPKVPKLSKEEEILREKWNRLLEMVHKGRLEPLKTFLEREKELGGIDAQIPEWAGERWATILQLAVHTGHEDMVQWMLEDGGADPTIPVPSLRAGQTDEPDEAQKSDDPSEPASRPQGSRRTAYDAARTKNVRDIFRRTAGLYPERWDWLGAGRVPSVLSQEMEEERDEKKKVRRKGLKDRVREREAKEKDLGKQQPPVPTPPPVESPTQSQSLRNPTTRKLGGASGAAEGVAGLTPEMRAKVERERRARAAEARLKALGAN
ncbi:hypothetical protein D9619_006128 [Psilocybe cf. subviscida]|uniref:VLRF1 domain-containing protein n=1 Tax=Psilocybe cf. subviscida TaxID=2480587 RepID=A0A8H5EY93_9AGAR|nr:hypothetical protein D9619_006128 [Psilocybe cf. subviscida]